MPMNTPTQQAERLEYIRFTGIRLADEQVYPSAIDVQFFYGFEVLY